MFAFFRTRFRSPDAVIQTCRNASGLLHPAVAPLGDIPATPRPSPPTTICNAPSPGLGVNRDPSQLFEVLEERCFNGGDDLMHLGESLGPLDLASKCNIVLRAFP
jgi:hypothetical protein